MRRFGVLLTAVAGPAYSIERAVFGAVWHDRDVSGREGEDSELVRRILSGEGDLYTVLVERYKIRLYRFVERYTNDAEDARDVTQDVFVKVYGALDSYDPRYKFSTWLFRIAGNAAIDHLRRRRVRTLPLEAPPNAEGESQANANSRRLSSEKETGTSPCARNSMWPVRAIPLTKRRGT